MKRITTLLIAALGVATSAGEAAAQPRLEAQTEDGSVAELSLHRERLRVAIRDQYARAVFNHEFENASRERLEGRYVIQAGDEARVRGFAYWNGEQKIVGEVFEKQTARQVYEEVTGLGRDPGLLEQIGEGAFSFRVFPIEPGEIKPVEVTVGKRLPRRESLVEYRAPLASSGADIEIDLRDARPLASITSPTHSLSIDKRGEHRAVIRATADPDASTSELVLRYRVEENDWDLSTYVHKDAGHDGYLLLSLATPALRSDAEVSPKDVTIVLDRSGSMSGDALENAKRAAAEIVTRLRESDRLNIILFDDGVESLFDTPQPVTDETRREALAYLEAVRDGGGTDIARALRHALGSQVDGARPRTVLFLTDGQSSSQDALAAAAADDKDVRLFTVGLGSGVAKPLLSRLAREKRGRFTYIDSAAAVGERMATLYEQIDAPVLVDVALEIDGVRTSRRYPRTMPDLYRKDELVVVARVRGTGRARIALRGMLGGEPTVFATSVDIDDGTRNPWVGRLWAESRTDDLLEEIALHGEQDELKDEVVDLAVAYNFSTPYTSFLAIPESELTESARSTLASAREEKQEILAAHRDAVALSRSVMPPGDPILSIKAPADAQQVTAYFPFGLVEDLEFDSDTESWKVRFLVPKGVEDGTYSVRIVIRNADDSVEVAEVPYTIDSSSPEIEVEAQPTSTGAHIEVTGAEQLRSATVVAGASGRTDLSLRAGGLGLSGDLELSPGRHSLTVVVADEARNETTRVVEVVVK